MARRTNEQAQQTRENILRGALDVFSEKGFSRSTLSDIAKRIGMTRGRCIGTSRTSKSFWWS